ncbi:uncharacterized protein [Rutidosis leptorrhynchoides]|uniref:uncharacterized protein isoform X2 n=1 Tax=Rutidosis leptorrhynchoides TaxID=125765 RepID=UPI003A99F68E
MDSGNSQRRNARSSSGRTRLPGLEADQELTSDDRERLRETMFLFQNPEILRAGVRNDPRLREIVDQNPQILENLNNPAILRQEIDNIQQKLNGTPSTRLPGNLTEAAIYVMNNPDVAHEIVRNNPGMREEMVNGGPEFFRKLLNDLDPQTRETLTNPQLYNEMMSNLRAAAPQNQLTKPKPPAAATTTTGGTAAATIALKPTVTLNVRVLNGPTFSVKASLEATVDLFKFVLQKTCQVPAREQRLVFNGRIFYKDENTLKSYGFEG